MSRQCETREIRGIGIVAIQGDFDQASTWARPACRELAEGSLPKGLSKKLALSLSKGAGFARPPSFCKTSARLRQNSVEPLRMLLAVNRQAF